MPRHYSLYEAKAKLSALVRQVREGQSVVITVHGEPAVEMRAVPKVPKKQTNDERVAELRAEGILTPAKRPPQDFPAILKEIRKKSKPIPGALQRFLDDR